MDINRLAIFSGFLSCALVVALTVIRQRRLDIADVGPCTASFLSGLNIPAAIFLSTYALYPDPATVLTKLHGFEKYVTVAGVVMLLLSVAAISTQCVKAFKVT